MKHTALLVAAIFALLVLPACTLARAAENSEKANEKADKAVQTTEMIKERILNGDLNKDGRLDAFEWLQIGLNSVLGGVALWGAVKGSSAASAANAAHARIDSKGKEIDQLYDATHAPIASPKA